MKETLVFLLAPRADARIPPPTPALRVRGYPRMHPPSVMCKTRFPAGSAQSCRRGAPRAAAEAAGGPGGAGRRARGGSSGSTGEGTRRGSAAPSLRAAPWPPPLPPGRAGPPPHPAPRPPPAPAPSRAGRRGDGGSSARQREAPERAGTAALSGTRRRGPLSPCGRSARGSSGYSSARPPEPAAQPERSSRGAQHLCMCFIGTFVVFDGAQAKRASTSLSSLNIFSRGLACKRVKCSRQSKLTIAG